MSIAKTHAERTPHDLSHLVFSAGEMGRLQTLSVVPVLGGDSYQQNLVGSLKLSPLRRGLCLDSVVDIFSFYIPHRHIYGDTWNTFLQAGIQSTPIPSSSFDGKNTAKFAHLALNVRTDNSSTFPFVIPEWRYKGYENIYNNYFKFPDDTDKNIYGDVSAMPASDGFYGRVCTHKKAIWTHKLPEKRTGYDTKIPVAGAEATLSLQDLNAAYGALHTEQERELFGQRFRDVVKNLGGKTPYDADNRPRLLARSEQWSSGHDIDGTTELTLGQHTGRINQTINHSVPRFAVPEHGAVWTVAVARFPPIHTEEAHYLNTNALMTYQDVAGDPAIVANQPRHVVSKGNMFYRKSLVEEWGEVPHSQWYRTHPNTVHSVYQATKGFPFLEQDYVTSRFNYYRPNESEPVFQTTQLAHWNIQARNNVTVMRALPTARDSLMVNN